MTDWYEHRHDLRPGMIFDSCWGVVKLDYRKPGDGTDWVVQTWCGVNKNWSYEGSTIHPGDLYERLYIYDPSDSPAVADGTPSNS